MRSSRRIGAALLVLALFMVALTIVTIASPNNADAQSGTLTRESVAQTNCQRGEFLSFHGQERPGAPPSNWSGPYFELSQDYPTRHPGFSAYQRSLEGDPGPYDEWLRQRTPWLEVSVSDLDTREGALRYINTVKTYALDGNTDADVDWAGQLNPVRPWFHVPWMDTGPGGREAAHGLVQELTAKPGVLGPQQKDPFQTWAVGMYNDLGGWAIGQVWCDPLNPNLSFLNPNQSEPNSFPNGTAAVKLLFTTGSTPQVPIAGSKAWTAHIPPALPPPTPTPLPGVTPTPEPTPEYVMSSERQDRTVHLLQMDMAVRDDRLPIGWAFMTFGYDENSDGETIWDRMVPLGLQWGDDPGVTAAMAKDDPSLIRQSWINDEYDELSWNHLGWGRRLAGPLDNKNSSCMSCHQTAGSPQAPILPELAPWLDQSNEVVTPERARLNWFTNVTSGVTYSGTQRESSDFSLQLSGSLRSFYLAKCDPRVLDEVSPMRGPGHPSPSEIAASTCEGLSQTVIAAASVKKPPAATWKYVVVAIAALALGALLATWWDRRRERRVTEA